MAPRTWWVLSKTWSWHVNQMISNQFQRALPHAVISKVCKWPERLLVSFYAWRNTKTLFKGFKYFRDLLDQLQNYLIKILTNCQLIMSIWVPVEKNQCKLPLKQAVEYSRDMTFLTVLSCIITAVDSAHKDQYIYKTAERIPQKHFDGTTTSLRVVISIWMSVINCQVITFIMNSHDSLLTISVPNSECKYTRICPKFWANTK